MNSLTDIFYEFFDVHAIPYYCLGLLTFIFHVVSAALDKSKRKPFTWYIQEFCYAAVSIIIGISICFVTRAENSVIWIVVASCGMFGSTIIRTLYDQKEKISDKAVTKITEKVIDTTTEKIGNEIIKSDTKETIKETEITEEDVN